eukprot:4259879-Pyramimonas_sp.AAC.2
MFYASTLDQLNAPALASSELADGALQQRGDRGRGRYGTRAEAARRRAGQGGIRPGDGGPARALAG